MASGRGGFTVLAPRSETALHSRSAPTCLLARTVASSSTCPRCMCRHDPALMLARQRILHCAGYPISSGVLRQRFSCTSARLRAELSRGLHHLALNVLRTAREPGGNGTRGVCRRGAAHGLVGGFSVHPVVYMVRLLAFIPIWPRAHPRCCFPGGARRHALARHYQLVFTKSRDSWYERARQRACLHRADHGRGLHRRSPHHPDGPGPYRRSIAGVRQIPSPRSSSRRDIYIREGCYNCHRSQIRTLVGDVLRYGESPSSRVDLDPPYQGLEADRSRSRAPGGKYPLVALPHALPAADQPLLDDPTTRGLSPHDRPAALPQPPCAQSRALRADE